MISDTVDASITVTGTSCALLGGSDSTIGNAVDCQLPTVGAGSTVTLTVTYDVPFTTSPQTITNTAAFSSDEQASSATNTASLTIDSAPDADGDLILDISRGCRRFRW